MTGYTGTEWLGDSLYWNERVNDWLSCSMLAGRLEVAFSTGGEALRWWSVGVLLSDHLWSTADRPSALLWKQMSLGPSGRVLTRIFDHKQMKERWQPGFRKADVIWASRWGLLEDHPSLTGGDQRLFVVKCVAKSRVMNEWEQTRHLQCPPETMNEWMNGFCRFPLNESQRGSSCYGDDAVCFLVTLITESVRLLIAWVSNWFHGKNNRCWRLTIKRKAGTKEERMNR